MTVLHDYGARCRTAPYEKWHVGTRSVRPVYRVRAWRDANEDFCELAVALRRAPPLGACRWPAHLYPPLDLAADPRRAAPSPFDYGPFVAALARGRAGGWR